MASPWGKLSKPRFERAECRLENAPSRCGSGFRIGQRWGGSAAEKAPLFLKLPRRGESHCRHEKSIFYAATPVRAVFRGGRFLAIAFFARGPVVLGLAIGAKRLGQAASPRQSNGIFHKFKFTGTRDHGGADLVLGIVWRDFSCYRTIVPADRLGADRQHDHGLRHRRS